MTDPTNHPQGAEETLKRLGISPEDMAHYAIFDCVIDAMNRNTADWLKYFAERVKGESPLCSDGSSDDLTIIDDVAVDSLLSEVTEKMKEGKP